MASDYEFTYNGLTFGDDNAHGVLSVEGLSPPPVRVDSSTRMVDHGSFAYGEYLEERHVIISGDLVDTVANLPTRESELRAAFRPQRVPLGLVFKRPNEVEKRINCIPIRLSFPYDREYSRGYMEWVVELLAEDPRIYESAQNSQNITSGSTQVIANAGTFPTWPTITFNAGATNPKIENLTTNEYLLITGSVPSGTVVDFANRTIMSGGTSLYDQLSGLSTWWDLEPGNNSIKNTAGGATVAVTWRGAWN